MCVLQVVLGNWDERRFSVSVLEDISCSQFSTSSVYLVAVNDFIIDHLTHCNLASSAKIPSQDAALFPELTLL